MNPSIKKMRISLYLVLTSTLLLGGCDDTQRGQVNGLPVYCNPLGGVESVIADTCIGCEIENVENAGDGNFRTAATVNVQASPDEGGAAIRSGTIFFLPAPPASKPGAFIKFPKDEGSLISWVTMRVRTYSSLLPIADESAQVGSQIGLIEGGLKRVDLPSNGDPTLPDAYVYFDAEQSFDTIEFEFAAPGLRTQSATVQVFAVCEDGGLR